MVGLWESNGSFKSGQLSCPRVPSMPHPHMLPPQPLQAFEFPSLLQKIKSQPQIVYKPVLDILLDV
jgi:hypothetical protein